MIAAKAAAVVREGMVGLVCVGEGAPPAEGAQDLDVDSAVEQCAIQIQSVLHAIPPQAAIIFAYEPLWAIGAEMPAPGWYVKLVVGRLRAFAMRVRGGQIQQQSRATGAGKEGSVGGDVRFLYGGSAGPGVWGHVGRGVGVGKEEGKEEGKGKEEGEEGVDGLFLGRFAHDVERFLGVVGEVCGEGSGGA